MNGIGPLELPKRYSNTYLFCDASVITRYLGCVFEGTPSQSYHIVWQAHQLRPTAYTARLLWQICVSLTHNPEEKYEDNGAKAKELAVARYSHYYNQMQVGIPKGQVAIPEYNTASTEQSKNTGPPRFEVE